MTQLASAGSQPVSNVFFRHQGALAPDIRWLGRPHCASASLLQMLFMESRHCLVPFWVLTQWETVRMLVWLVQVWDTHTGEPVGKFPTFSVYAMTLSPTLIQHSPGDRLIALWHRFTNTISIPAIWSRVENTHCIYTRWNQVVVLSPRLWLEDMGHSRSHGWALAFRSWLWTRLAPEFFP